MNRYRIGPDNWLRDSYQQVWYSPDRRHVAQGEGRRWQLYGLRDDFKGLLECVKLTDYRPVGDHYQSFEHARQAATEHPKGAGEK